MITCPDCGGDGIARSLPYRNIQGMLDIRDSLPRPRSLHAKSAERDIEATNNILLDIIKDQEREKIALEDKIEQLEIRLRELLTIPASQREENKP